MSIYATPPGANLTEEERRIRHAQMMYLMGVAPAAAGAGAQAFVFVNSTNETYTGAATTTSTLPALSLTPGNNIFVHVAIQSAATASGVTDTAGNVYTALTRASNGGAPCGSQWWYKLNAAGHAANIVTATFAPGAPKWMTSLQFSKTGAVFDVENAVSVFGPTITSGSFSTSAAGLMLAGRVVANFQATSSFDQGIIWVDPNVGNPSQGGGGAWNIGSVGYRITTGALGPITVTETSPGTVNKAMSIACFK